MSGDDDTPTDEASLRRRAEKRVKAPKADDAAARTVADPETARLLHQLQVHKIELELQNDELRIAQSRVEALLAQYTDLYDFAPVGYVTLDRHGTVRHVNLVGAGMLNIERSRLVGRRFGLFIGPDDRAVFNDFVERMFATGLRKWCDVAPPQKDRRQLVIRLESACSADGDQCRVVMVDISERKRTEDSLALQGAALNAAANAIAICDRAGAIEWVNSAFTELTGYSAEEAIGRSPDILLRSGAHDDAFFKECWDVVHGGGIYRGEITNRRKDGSTYIESRTITPVIDDHGAASHYITISQDLTEYRRLEMQLLQAQKMETIGQLAGGVAHDFNNLLTVINGTADLAMQKLKDDDPLRMDLKEIEQAGERAASLTRQLLAFGRKQIMQFQTIDLGRMLVEIEKMVQRLIGEQIVLDVSVPEGLGSVFADPMQLGHVIMNLAVNARDAMPAGGKLSMAVRNVEFDASFTVEHPSVKPGRYVMLTVSDTGLGMDEATVGRIFEPFFTTKETGKGTGLGLSTVYGIVKQSMGSIWAYSQLDKGTTITICLPLVERIAPPEQSAPAPASSVAAPARVTVLIVEDEEAVRRLAQRALEAAGWSVLIAVNGADALAMIDQHDGTIDVVLTDMIMPVMGGLELGKRLREKHPQIRVIYTSGYTMDLGNDNYTLGSSVDFIGKPYTSTLLTQKVRDALDS